MKPCIRCDVEKELDEFPDSECHSDGKDNRCKACKNEVNREYKLRKKQGLVKPRYSIKKASDVHIEPFDPDLEDKRRIKHLVKRFGKEGAVAKIKLEAFRT